MKFCNDLGLMRSRSSSRTSAEAWKGNSGKWWEIYRGTHENERQLCRLTPLLLMVTGLAIQSSKLMDDV
ncbi:hypothetical protein Q8A67_001490 [Cirrhinus molitorella]|uniref:Uncharacterized protein n=1 Tax=Cirrhinus molitorella TaxID=172907 RepID=A0AA88Q9W2_9TELE|nr:hypothetical protein Q8A67_001490 [Cirrhinus molitorella]